MRGSFQLIAVLLVIILIAGCGSTKPPATTTTPASKDIISAIPDWATNVPQDPNFIFANGTATSRDMQLAKDKASSSARMTIAKSVEVRMNGLSKRFQEEVGTAEDSQYLDMFTQASKEVVDLTLTGVVTEKTKIMNEGGIFRVYVLLKLPIGASSQALLNKLKQQEQMYTRFRSTEVFKELEEETNKFDEFKKTQGE